MLVTGVGIVRSPRVSLNCQSGIGLASRSLLHILFNLYNKVKISYTTNVPRGHGRPATGDREKPVGEPAFSPARSWARRELRDSARSSKRLDSAVPFHVSILRH